MAIDAPETNDTAEGSTSLVADVAIAALLLAMFAAILAPHWQKTAAVEQEDEHLHDIATAAGSLLSAVSLQRAEALTKGGTIKRDFDAPRTGALKVVPRPIAADTCAHMWNTLLPDGPTVTTGGESAFTVDVTDQRGVCLYRYTGSNDERYVISYRPDSGQVAYE